MVALKKNENAVSEVIGAMLILLILVLFLGILQAYEVPEWNKELESIHFNIILDDVFNMKRVLQETAVYDVPRTTIFHSSFNYPNRMFLINPLKPSVMLTTNNDKQIRITYNDNTSEQINSCTIQVKENYNYFSAPTLIIEHGMIIGDVGQYNYSIDDPLLNNQNIDLLLVNCDNTSFGTSSSVSLRLYPVLLNEITVNNATLSFNTDYPILWSTYLASIQANWTLSGNIITMKYSNSTKIRILSTSIDTPSSLTVLPTPTPTPVLTSIEVSPSPASVSREDYIEFNAKAMDQYGMPMQGITISWSVDNIILGTVSPLNSITDSNGQTITTFNASKQKGTTAVTATNGTIAGNATVKVT